MTDTLTKIPAYVAVAIIFTDLAVGIALWLGITRIVKRLNLPANTQRITAVLMAVVPTAWLLLAPTLAATMNSYVPALHPGAPTIGMLPLILMPVAIGLLLLRSRTWQNIVVTAPQHWLIGIQIYRIIGIVFLPLMVLDILPAYFAIPAGYGDLITGLLAPLVAYWVWKQGNGWRYLAILWNAIGLLDLAIAVGIGSGILYSNLSHTLFNEKILVTQPFAYFPLSLIPLFVVPIATVLHIYSLIKLISQAQTTTTKSNAVSVLTTDVQ
ncbi:hypothetical protein [Fischerella sp. PCC 9605]|uniref:hypothetical protein n=1 Tax=Fischerella sp. PCC 9605 TaxID=1173024 RepID=UPI00047BA87E|nr:hypothetical protein [Fischerella sp. PCC 9605]